MIFHISYVLSQLVEPDAQSKFITLLWMKRIELGRKWVCLRCRNSGHQNAYSLQRWVENNPDARPLHVSYTLPISLERSGVESDGTVSTEPTAGWMVVGVNELFTRSGRLDWLHEHEPIAMIGYAIWVFRIKDDVGLP